MAVEVTLADLRTRVRRRADMESSTFCTDAEIDEYVQRSTGELFDLIIQNNGANWFTWFAIDNPANVTVAGGRFNIIYTLGQTATTVYKIVYVEVQINGVWGKVRQNPAGTGMMSEGHTRTGGWQNHNEVTYQFARVTNLEPIGGPPIHAAGSAESEYLVWSPVPQAIHSFRMAFIPQFGDWIANPTQVFTNFSGWDDYIVCDAAAKCLEKEESFAHADRLLARKAQLAERISWHAQTVNEDGQGRIRELEDEYVRDRRSY